ncbi:MAG: hypothetical protein O4806_02040 [Trichodesmium sp. St5_bin8]|nr:hypothetical protein [Trichodesmium sp. St4_bin8_1]MDE5070707.1 hypothetical protein [Trichodesmium sp. St5_bin8]
MSGTNIVAEPKGFFDRRKPIEQLNSLQESQSIFFCAIALRAVRRTIA